MKVIIDLCVVPLGVGVSVSEQVVLCQTILEASGLSYQMHAYGTNIEGEWDAVFSAIEKCHQQLHADGVPRISTTIKLGTRIDRNQSMQDKIDSVNEKLAR